LETRKLAVFERTVLTGKRKDDQTDVGLPPAADKQTVSMAIYHSLMLRC
jgi:hypothetical protein